MQLPDMGATMFGQSGWGLPAAAQTQPQNQTASTGLWDRANLVGDMGGLRTILGD